MLVTYSRSFFCISLNCETGARCYWEAEHVGTAYRQRGAEPEQRGKESRFLIGCSFYKILPINVMDVLESAVGAFFAFLFHDRCYW